MEKKFCLACSALIRGRSDKRFCDDGCRNAHNNKINSAPNNFVRHINTTLRRNRRILEGLLGNEKILKISRENLLKTGLDMDYFTNQLCNAKGQVYFFVYEFGYLSIERDHFLLVRQQLPLSVS
ncbi:hypothetical protein [Sphingobacterium deserti]|uniref:DUF2116 family Zn-ribbon domain-containing protein n=1 Tax=Sphingobacterium deserti TaxID=1229276 RepID=A0A0B8T5V9_9SPHI|nr:hypothetical protein [Sphingobacterium deserti]KGE16148.1 hypothetical protein DI53_0263 [Sphingobacterium deserti]